MPSAVLYRELDSAQQRSLLNFFGFGGFEKIETNAAAQLAQNGNVHWGGQQGHSHVGSLTSSLAGAGVHDASSGKSTWTPSLAMQAANSRSFRAGPVTVKEPSIGTPTCAVTNAMVYLPSISKAQAATVQKRVYAARPALFEEPAPESPAAVI